MVFGVVTCDNNITTRLIFPQDLKLTTMAYIKILGISWIERGLLEDPTSGNRILRYAIQAGEPSVGCEKISRHHQSKYLAA